MVKQGIVPADEEVANILRASGKPVVLVVNKIDSVNQNLIFMNSIILA